MNRAWLIALLTLTFAAVWWTASVAHPATAAVVAGIGAASILLASTRGAQPLPELEPLWPEPPDHDDISDLIELFAEGVLLLDEERTVIAVNQSAARILERPREGMVGVSLIRAARDHAFVEVLRESSGEPREVLLGDQRVIFATSAAVDAGEIRTVLTLQDLTLLRRAERARQELVANVSHELRTPIAAALALAETLDSGVDDEEQRARFSSQLTSEIERLGTMVDRLLRLSRLESRVEEFQIEHVDVASLLDEAVRRIAPVAERKQITIDVQIGDYAGAVAADRERVLEVLSNLIDNAIRHSPAGATVRMTTSRVADMVQFSVRDYGPGIMPHERARIFERFYTGDRARTEGRGTGLGLSIARHIVSRHGGEIWVGDETPGAVLRFTLPAADAASSGPPVPAAP